MSNERPGESVVFIVDDDDALRAAVGRLVRSIGLNVVLLASAREFLAQKLPNAPCCLVLDVRLPGLGGLDFQAELAKANVRTPIIFLTAYGDIPMTVKAMKAGAVEFLTKPFRDQDLIDAIQLALERDRKRRKEESVVSLLRSKFETLSPREQEVMAYVTSGLLNKQIATEIGITENTVKLHRGHLPRASRQPSDFVQHLIRVGAPSRRRHGPCESNRQRQDAALPRGARDERFMPVQLPAVTFSVRGIAGRDVHRELAALVGPTSAQPGCLRCALLHDAENPAAFELVEEWASRAELDAHFRSEDCRRLLAAIDRSHVPPVFRVHTLAACDGIEAIAAARGSGLH